MVKYLFKNNTGVLKRRVKEWKTASFFNFRNKVVKVISPKIESRSEVLSEKPNLSYIKTLSNSDIKFQTEFL